MAEKSIFGWIAGGITLIYKLPQIYKLIKSKDAASLSIRSLGAQTLGYIFYGIHGYIREDLPILAMGGISLFQNILLIILCCKFNSAKTEET